MRPNTRDRPGGTLGPRPTYSPAPTLAGTALLFAAFAVLLVAVSYPEPAVLVGSVATAGGLAVRTARERLRSRRETGRTTDVCVPVADVCVEA
jgi:hypothetical protein